MISLSRKTGSRRTFSHLVLSLLLTFTLSAASFSVSVKVSAAPTSSINVYLDSVLIGTITASDINAGAGSYSYTGNRSNLTNGSYTATGTPLLALLQAVVDDAELTLNVPEEVISVTFTSPVGPNYTRSFNNPAAQLFASRYTFPDPDTAVSGTLVPAILATAINSSGDDAIRLLFGTLNAAETNIPYFLSNISQIDLYTTGTFTGGYAY